MSKNVQDLLQQLQYISILPSPSTTQFSMAWKSEETKTIKYEISH